MRGKVGRKIGAGWETSFLSIFFDSTIDQRINGFYSWKKMIP
jgi:hypothetical protein